MVVFIICFILKESTTAKSSVQESPARGEINLKKLCIYSKNIYNT